MSACRLPTIGAAGVRGEGGHNWGFPQAFRSLCCGRVHIPEPPLLNLASAQRAVLSGSVPRLQPSTEPRRGEVAPPPPPIQSAKQVAAVASLGFFGPLGFAEARDEGLQQSPAGDLKHRLVAMMASVDTVAQRVFEVASRHADTGGQRRPSWIDLNGSVLSAVTFAVYNIALMGYCGGAVFQTVVVVLSTRAGTRSA